MNWGNGITVVIAVFVLGITLMVYTSMTKDTELVTKNYYEKELRYQEHIDRMNNSNSLNKNVLIEHVPGNIIITFPKEGIMDNIKGEISFYKPSAAKEDFSIPVELNSNFEQLLGTDKLSKGMWKVMVSWSSGNVNYYSEEKIMIQ